MVLGAVVLVAARLTYQIDLDVIDDSVPGELHGQVQNAKTVHEDLERFLGESEVVGALGSGVDDAAQRHAGAGARRLWALAEAAGGGPRLTRRAGA